MKYMCLNRKKKLFFILSLLSIIILSFTACSNYYKWKTFEEYCEDLANSGNFVGNATEEEITNFTNIDYDFNNEACAQIKEKYKTDEVAGNGSTLDKTKNILSWVADKITHNGSASVPEEYAKNSFTMLNYSYGNEDKGINCRAVAIVLNDCLKSIGIKSKICFLMPKQGNTGDNHVGNMVYIDNLQKWILIDGSWNAYFQDDNGLYLDVFELRDAFANGNNVNVNDKAHWNHNEYTADQDSYYKKYLSKNLYYFRTYNNPQTLLIIAPNDLSLNEWYKENEKLQYEQGWITKEVFKERIKLYQEKHFVTFSKEIFLMV